MMKDTMVTTIKKILFAYTDIPYEDIEQDMVLKKDLHIRETDVDAMIYEIEEHLGCDIGGGTSGIVYVSDLIASVKSAL